jgi:hypothetical protein
LGLNAVGASALGTTRSTFAGLKLAPKPEAQSPGAAQHDRSGGSSPPAQGDKVPNPAGAKSTRNAQADHASAPPVSPGAATEEPDRPAAAAPAPDGDWAHRTRIRDSAWKTRLLIDPILPTAPTGDTSLAALETLRRRLLAEQRTKMPRSFVRPQGTRGYVIDLAGAGPTGPWQWETPGTSAAFRARVTAQRAELAWNEGAALPSGTYRLTDRGGKAVVRLTIAPGAPAVVESAPETSVRAWFQLQLDPADRAALNRFKWQRTSGGNLPATWTEQDGNDFTRIEAPIGAAAGQGQNDRFAVFDSESGWGLTGSLTQTALNLR